MSDLRNLNDLSEITAEDQLLNAHQYLLEFLDKFDSAHRGGIHDFMEIAIYNMINSSVKNIDDYLKTGHKQVNANEIMAIVVESYQKVLDGIKRNLESMKQVNFR